MSDVFIQKRFIMQTQRTVRLQLTESPTSWKPFIRSVIRALTIMSFVGLVMQHREACMGIIIDAGKAVSKNVASAFITIAAGTALDTIYQYLEKGTTSILRALIATPILIGCAIAGFYVSHDLLKPSLMKPLEHFTLVQATKNFICDLFCVGGATFGAALGYYTANKGCDYIASKCSPAYGDPQYGGRTNVSSDLLDTVLNGTKNGKFVELIVEGNNVSSLEVNI